MPEEAKHTYPKHHVRHAKELRVNSTKAETVLWKELQKLKTSKGLKFRRQQPVDCYIVDFICPLARVIVEIDGLSHDSKQASDIQRVQYLEGQGFNILRLTDNDVLTDPETVVATILTICESRLAVSR